MLVVAIPHTETQAQKSSVKVTWKSEVGGAQPGNRFVSCVCAYMRFGCRVELELTSYQASYPYQPLPTPPTLPTLPTLPAERLGGQAEPKFFGDCISISISAQAPLREALV